MVDANKVMVVHIEGHDAQNWRNLNTETGNAVASILAKVHAESAGQGTMSVVIPFMWADTTTQDYINRLKEIYINMEEEREACSPEEWEKKVMDEIEKSSVPSMFENHPFEQSAVDQIEDKNKMRPDRPWKYDHLMNGTTGCHLTADQMANPIGMNELVRLLGLSESLRQERMA